MEEDMFVHGTKLEMIKECFFISLKNYDFLHFLVQKSFFNKIHNFLKKELGNSYQNIHFTEFLLLMIKTFCLLHFEAYD